MNNNKNNNNKKTKIKTNNKNKNKINKNKDNSNKKQLTSVFSIISLIANTAVPPVANIGSNNITVELHEIRGNFVYKRFGSEVFSFLCINIFPDLASGITERNACNIESPARIIDTAIIDDKSVLMPIILRGK